MNTAQNTIPNGPNRDRDEVRVLQINYASAQEIADKVQKLFESRTPKPGQRAGSMAPMAMPPSSSAGVPGAAGGTTPTADAGGAATLSQLIPDERTNVS